MFLALFVMFGCHFVWFLLTDLNTELSASIKISAKSALTRTDKSGEDIRVMNGSKRGNDLMTVAKSSPQITEKRGQI